MLASVRTLTASAAALLVATASLPAQTITLLNSDAQGTAWSTANGFSKVFGGTVRAGNRQTNGDWELALVGPTDAPISGIGQVAWNAGNRDHGYFLSMDEFGDAFLALDFGAPTDPFVTATVTPTGINTLIARLRTGTNASVALSPFTIFFDAGGSLVVSGITGDADAEWVAIQDARFAGGFFIAANDDFDAAQALFDPAMSTGSQSIYQFKIGTTNVVPEPSTYALLATGLAVLGAFRRRRSNATN